MIVLLNGSFGVGKSTVAGLLRKRLKGAIIYDPEWTGSVLQRLPEWLNFKGSGTDDFQNLHAWRRSVIAGTKLFGRIARGPVLVPMTFTRRDYFDEITAGIRRFDRELNIFCLHASLGAIEKRLAHRGSGGAWLSRRVQECVEAHRDPHFGAPVDTENRSAPEVADDIFGRLQSGIMDAQHDQRQPVIHRGLGA
jgi:hypothetical protein